MGIKLLGSEKFVTNSRVSAGESISAIARVQHNYPALSNQAKMMVTGRFNIEQQWLFKAGSEPYNEDGEVIDYSGQGNDAELSGEYGIKFNTASGFPYYKTPGNDNLLFNNDDGASLRFTVKDVGGMSDLYDKTRFRYLNSGGQGWHARLVSEGGLGTIQCYIPITTLPLGTEKTRTLYLRFKKSEGLQIWVEQDGVLYTASDTTVIPGFNVISSVLLWVFRTDYSGYGSNIMLWNKAKSIDEMRDITTTDLYFWCPCQGTLTNDVSGNGRDLTVANGTGSSTSAVIDGRTFYNLKYGFRKISNDGGATIVYQPALLDGSGYPALPGGYSIISQHPAGLWHNGAETEIVLDIYGAKSYDEMKALAIANNQFELVEDENGNLSEIKVFTLDTQDTEHYTADNNSQQTLTESGNLTSPIDQNVKLLIQGGDNESVAASKQFTFSGGAELTITAATSGTEGNEIKLIFVQGATRGINVTYGADITITLTYEAGDDISDCTGELDSVNYLITYVIDTDGALSDISTDNQLTGGFTPEVEVKQITFQNNSILALPSIPSEDGTITITGEDTVEFDFPCRGGIETVITCDISSTGTTTRPSIIIMKEDDIIDSDTAVSDEDTLSVKVVPASDQVYTLWLYAKDSTAGANTEFSNLQINGVQGIINDRSEIYPVIARFEDVFVEIVPENSLYKTYIRLAEAYTRPATAGAWAAFLATFTRVGVMELRSVKALIEPELASGNDGQETASYYKLTYQSKDFNYNPESIAAYRESWDNKLCDVLLVAEDSGYAVILVSLRVNSSESANSGERSYIELKATKQGRTKDSLRDMFDIPE